MTSGDAGAFNGAKAAVFIGTRLLCLLRDDTPGLRWAGYWDFPGGGREGDETPRRTLAREMEEEVGLDAGDAEELWHWSGPSVDFPGTVSWFFVLRLAAGAERAILMGDEGAAWALLPQDRVLAMPDVVPSMRDRLGLWRRSCGAVPGLRATGL